MNSGPLGRSTSGTVWAELWEASRLRTARMERILWNGMGNPGSLLSRLRWPRLRDGCRYLRFPGHPSGRGFFHRNVVDIQGLAYRFVECDLGVRVIRHGLDFGTLI